MAIDISSAYAVNDVNEQGRRVVFRRCGNQPWEVAELAALRGDKAMLGRAREAALGVREELDKLIRTLDGVLGGREA